MLRTAKLKVVQTLEDGSYVSKLELPPQEPGEVRRVFLVRRFLADPILGLWEQEEKLYLDRLEEDTLEIVLPPTREDQEFMVKVTSEVFGGEEVVSREAAYLTPRIDPDPGDVEGGGQE